MVGGGWSERCEIKNLWKVEALKYGQEKGAFARGTTGEGAGETWCLALLSLLRQNPSVLALSPIITDLELTQLARTSSTHSSRSPTGKISPKPPLRECSI